jgi:hypothetical protein
VNSFSARFFIVNGVNRADEFVEHLKTAVERMRKISEIRDEINRGIEGLTLDSKVDQKEYVPGRIRHQGFLQSPI